MISRCYSAAVVSALVLLLVGCTATVESEPQPQKLSLARLKSLYRGVPLRVESDVAFEAVVVGSDRYGNFANRVTVEDATGGIALMVEGKELFGRYRIGDTLHIECNSLTLGSRGDAICLGGAPSGGSEVSPMDEATAALHIFVRGCMPQAPAPHALKIAELSLRYIDCYVKITGVRFVEQGQNWYSTEEQERHLVDEAADTLAVRTLSSALFASVPLPTGSGSICGILSYFAGRYSLRVNNDFDNDFE